FRLASTWLNQATICRMVRASHSHISCSPTKGFSLTRTSHMPLPSERRRGGTVILTRSQPACSSSCLARRSRETIFRPRIVATCARAVASCCPPLGVVTSRDPEAAPPRGAVLAPPPRTQALLAVLSRLPGDPLAMPPRSSSPRPLYLTSYTLPPLVVAVVDV